MSSFVIAKLHDAARQAFIHVNITGDAEGDLRDAVIIDPAILFGEGQPAVPSICLDKIQYGLIGFSCSFAFEYAGSAVPVWSIDKGNGAADFNWAGSLPDRAEQMGGHGKLVLTTTGLGEGKTGSLIIAVTKKR